MKIIIEALKDKLCALNKKIDKLERDIDYSPHLEFCRLQIRLGRIIKKYGVLSPVTVAFVNKYVGLEGKLKKDMQKHIGRDYLKMTDDLCNLNIQKDELIREIKIKKFRYK